MCIVRPLDINSFNLIRGKQQRAHCQLKQSGLRAACGPLVSKRARPPIRAAARSHSTSAMTTDFGESGPWYLHVPSDHNAAPSTYLFLLVTCAWYSFVPGSPDSGTHLLLASMCI